MIRTTDSNYPFKRNPLKFEDVAFAASLRWCVATKSALKYFREQFPDPVDAMNNLKENDLPPDAFWASL